jgi:hypothetical protein
LSEPSAERATIQRLAPALLPTQNVNSAPSREQAASHFSGEIAQTATVTTTFAFWIELIAKSQLLSNLSKTFRNQLAFCLDPLHRLRAFTGVSLRTC